MKLDEIYKISNSVQIILQAAEKKRDTLLQIPVAAYLHSKQEGFKKKWYLHWVHLCLSL